MKTSFTGAMILCTHEGESRTLSFTRYAVIACVDKRRKEAMTERISSCSDPSIENQFVRSTLPLEQTILSATRLHITGLFQR